MRRKPSSALAARIVDPDDHERRYVGHPRMGGERQDRLPLADPSCPQVVDNFPKVIPVVQRELDVIETYLGKLLDDMLNNTY